MRKFLFYLFLAFSLFAILGEASKVEAATYNGGADLSPSYISSGSSPYAIHYSLSNLLPETEYYLKIRLKKDNSYYGQTWNEESQKWLSQTAAWTDHPEIKTDNKGQASGFIFGRASTTSIPTSNYQLQIVIRKVSSTTNIEPSLNPQITVIDAQTEVGFVEGYAFNEDEEPIESAIVLVKSQDGEIIGSYITEDNEIDEGYDSLDFGYFKIALPLGDGYKMQLRDFGNEIISKTQEDFSIRKGKITNLGKIKFQEPEYPEAVEFLETEEITPASLKLKWSENQDGNFWYYEIFLSEDGINFVSLDQIFDQKITFYFVSHLLPQKRYYFMIRIYSQDEVFTDSELLSIQTPKIVYPSTVIINELLPRPKSDWNSDRKVNTSDEWVELYNTGKSEVNLTGWILRDTMGSVREYHFPNGTIIYPKSFLVFYKSLTGITLNDTGDVVELVHPDGKVTSRSAPNYGKAKGDWSYSRKANGSWAWTTTPTPLEVNRITKEIDEEEKPILTNIAGARRLGKGEEVVLWGIVTVPPGILGGRIFYIQDSLAGIQIYNSSGKFPPLRIGDRVKITGEISESSGEKRLKIKKSSDIRILGHGPPPLPLRLRSGQIGERYEGRLVKVSGKVTKTSGSIFYLNDGSGEIKIYLKSQTEIKKPKMRKGDFVEISGIVSQTTTGFRVLPRFQGDLILLWSSSKEKEEDFEQEKGEILGEKAEAKAPTEEITSSESPSNKSSFQILGWIIMGIGALGLLGVEIYGRIKRII